MNVAKIAGIGVIGAGQMGLGIAQVAAVCLRKPVLLYDANRETLNRGVNVISKKILLMGFWWCF